MFGIPLNAQNSLETSSNKSVQLFNDNELESELKVLEKFFELSQLDSAVYLGEKILRSAEHHQNQQIIKQSRLRLGRVYNHKNLFDKSDSILDDALKAGGDNKTMFDIWLLKSNNATRQGQTAKAKLALDQSLPFIDNPYGEEMFNYKIKLTGHYHITGNYIDALNTIIDAKNNKPNNIDYHKLFNLNYELGAIYAQLSVYQESLKVGQENAKLARQHNNYYLELFAIYTQLNAQLNIGEHSQTDSLFSRALILKKEHNASAAFGFAYYTKGRSLLSRNRVDSALHYFELGERFSKKTNARKEEAQNIAGKFMVYVENKELEKAKKELSKFDSIKWDLSILRLNDYKRKLLFLSGDFYGAYEQARLQIKEYQEKENSQIDYKLLSKLLDEKFKAATRVKENESSKKVRTLRNWLLLFFLLFIIITLFGIVLYQRKTKLKLTQLNDSLTKRNEALLSFNYISSHDLKEPVRNILNFSDLLKLKLSKYPLTEKEKSYLDILHNSSKTCLSIISSLKIFTETSFDMDEKAMVRFDRIINDLQINLGTLYRDTNAKVTLNISDELSDVLFPESWIYLLLQNLFQNALKYNDSETPSITLDVTTRKDDYLFSVRDNGRGIAVGQLEYIFKPFKTIQSKSKSQSSGLGLAICKNILDRLGGKIWVESVVNQGSTFLFSIPK